MPTASWARPCHSIRSIGGAVFPCGLQHPVRVECQGPGPASPGHRRGFRLGATRGHPGCVQHPHCPAEVADQGLARAGASSPAGFVAITLSHMPIMARSPRSRSCYVSRRTYQFHSPDGQHRGGGRAIQGPRPTVDWHAGSCDADRRRLPPERVRWRCWSRGRLRPGCCAARLPPSARLRPFGRCRPRGPQGPGRATLR